MGRKRVLLTNRDLALFKYLAYGPAFSCDIHPRFFTTAGKPITYLVFWKRLTKLVQAGYLQVMHPDRLLGDGKDPHGPVYAIAKGGVETLAQAGGVNIDRIRVVNLVRSSLVHEMIQTRLIRKIYEMDGTHYQVIRLLDDLMLSKQAHKIKAPRIPDIGFTVRLRSGSYYSFLVEIDAGTTHAGEFVQKLAAFPNLNRVLVPRRSKEPFAILIVCDTHERMTYLQRVVNDSPLTANIVSSFAFNSIYNLDNRLGLFNPWFKADGSKIERIFKESTPNPARPDPP